MDKDNFSIRLSIRLTEKEKNYLESEAKRLGDSLSVTARRLLFDKAKNAAGMTPSDEKKQLQLAAKSLAASFRKTASSVTGYIDMVRRNPAFDSGSLDAIRYALSEIQDELNRANAVMHAPEVHVVARPSVAKTMDRAEEKTGRKAVRRTTPELRIMIKYCNMEKIMLQGVIVEDAKKFKTKTGEERAGFKLLCQRQDASTGKPVGTYYEVSKKVGDDLFDLLKKDREVIVVGDFRHSLNVGTDGKTYVNLRVYADNINIAGLRG